MKNINWILVGGLFLFLNPLHAQDCTFYFPTKIGTSLETKTYDAKDKITGSAKSTILESSSTAVKFESEVFDKNDKSINKGTYEVKCEGGEFIIDMKSLVKEMDLSRFKNMEISFDSKNLSFPSKLQAGQKLKDGEITITMSSGGNKIMTMSINIINRIVEDFEDMTTPAGTFKCVKITSDVVSKTIVSVKSKTVEWVSEKIGVVRSENHDEQGKLKSYSILTSLKI
jgi:hypothetical protein